MVVYEPPIPLRILAQRIPHCFKLPALLMQPVDSRHRVGKLGPQPFYLAFLRKHNRHCFGFLVIKPQTLGS